MGVVLSILGLSVPAYLHSAGTTSEKKACPDHILHYSSKPALLGVRRHGKDPESDAVDYIPLDSLVETRCRSLATDFRPLWWLPNGHLQTLYCVLGDFSRVSRMWYRRRILRLLDGGTIGLDFAPLDSSHLSDDTPIVVVQHGLSGGSFEPYVRAILCHVCSPKEQGGLGFRAVVLNFRGCAGVPLSSPRLYSAGNTDDTRQALFYISQRYPRAPLLGLGFSLGANVMTRYLAEEGVDSRLDAGCVLACPWNLEKNNARLMRTFAGRELYSKGMGRSLINLLKRNRKMMLTSPDSDVINAVHSTMALKFPTLEQFDDHFTRVAGGSRPTFPFNSAIDYYKWASSHNAVKCVAVPFLAINAADDPIVQHVPTDVDNPFVVVRVTSGGGHLGWFHAHASMDRWTTRPVLEWLRMHGEDVVHARAKKEIFVDEEGWIREVGQEHLGCKEIEGEHVIDGNKGLAGTL